MVADQLLWPGAIRFLMGQMPNDDQLDPAVHLQIRQLSDYWIGERDSKPNQVSFFNLESFGLVRESRYIALDPIDQDKLPYGSST